VAGDRQGGVKNHLEGCSQTRHGAARPSSGSAVGAHGFDEEIKNDKQVAKWRSNTRGGGSLRLWAASVSYDTASQPRRPEIWPQKGR
jgi:hypothetical protein